MFVYSIIIIPFLSLVLIYIIVLLLIYYCKFLVPASFPNNLQVIGAGPFYIALKWDSLHDFEKGSPITDFHVTYWVQNSTLISTIYGVKGCFFVLTLLSPSTLYEISVSAANSFGVGPSSPSLFVLTFETG